MPKVKGPLFSLAASGTFQGAIEFRTVNGKTVAAGARTPPATRSAAQVAQAQRFGAAAAAWKLLDEPSKQIWKTAAAPTAMNGYQLYLSEYQGQNISPPGQPTPP